MRDSALVRYAVVATLSGLVQGCAVFRLEPPLPPAVAGCYAVSASRWTSAEAYITGFQALPEVIAIDTTYRGRAQAPIRWIEGDGRTTNSISLGQWTSDWSVEADTLVFPRSGLPHRLPDDSLIVVFGGWSGELGARLRRDDSGFTGSAFFYPRPEARGLASVTINLRRAACPTDVRWASRRTH